MTTLPDEIGELKKLEWLNERMETGDYLSKYNNQLTTSPDDIGELKELKMPLVAGDPVTLKEIIKVVKIQTISSHTHGTGSVFLLGILFKICDKYPCLFHMGVPLLPRPRMKH